MILQLPATTILDDLMKLHSARDAAELWLIVIKNPWAQRLYDVGGVDLESNQSARNAVQLYLRVAKSGLRIYRGEMSA